MSSRSFLRGATGRILLGLGCFLSSEAFLVPCTTSSSVELTVSSSLEASEAAEVVSCTGGNFTVQWLGNITVPGVFNISGGTYLSIYGGSTGPTVDVMDSGLANPLFAVSDGELNLERLTMTSAADESADSAQGGILFAYESAVTMTDCVVAGGSASVGGALYLRGSHLDIYGVTSFSNNKADKGGALYLLESHLDIFGVASFSNNIAESSGGAIFAQSNSSIQVVGEAKWLYNAVQETDYASGGAVRLSDSTLSVLGKATLHGNFARSGGAVDCFPASLFNATGEVEFSNNHAWNGGALGGNSVVEDYFVIYSLAGRISFFNNTALFNGGALVAYYQGDISITGEVDFIQNFAGDAGGAIAVAASTGQFFVDDDAIVRFTNNTCVGVGGGIAVWGGDGLRIGYFRDFAASLSFVGNTAGDAGGAIYGHTIASLFIYGEFDSTSVMNNSASTQGSAVFMNNSASTYGGAVFAHDVEDFRVDGVEFGWNTATFGGALMVETVGAGEMSFEGNLYTDNSGVIGDCAFFGNVAGEDGGAVNLQSGFLSLYSSTFDGNTAGESTLFKFQDGCPRNTCKISHSRTVQPGTCMLYVAAFWLATVSRCVLRTGREILNLFDSVLSGVLAPSVWGVLLRDVPSSTREIRRCCVKLRGFVSQQLRVLHQYSAFWPCADELCHRERGLILPRVFFQHHTVLR